jgi:hypothetical protein
MVKKMLFWMAGGKPPAIQNSICKEETSQWAF